MGPRALITNMCFRPLIAHWRKETDAYDFLGMDSNNKCAHILNVSHDDSDDTVSCCENVREYDGRVIR